VKRNFSQNKLLYVSVQKGTDVELSVKRKLLYVKTTENIQRLNEKRLARAASMTHGDVSELLDTRLSQSPDNI